MKKKRIILMLVIMVMSLGIIACGDEEDDKKKEKSTYETPIKASVKLINDKDTEFLNYLKYGNLEYEYKFNVLSEEYLEENENFEYEINDIIDKYGKDYELSYEIVEANEMDEEYVESIESYIKDVYEDLSNSEEDAYETFEKYCEQENISSQKLQEIKDAYHKTVEEYKTVKVKEVYEVTIDFVMTSELAEEEFTMKDILVAKIGNKWIFVRKDGNTWQFYNPVAPPLIHYEVRY